MHPLAILDRMLRYSARGWLPSDRAGVVDWDVVRRDRQAKLVLSTLNPTLTTARPEIVQGYGSNTVRLHGKVRRFIVQGGFTPMSAYGPTR